MKVELTWAALLSVAAWVVATWATVVVVDSAWGVLLRVAMALALAVVLRGPVEALASHVPRVVALLAVLAVSVGLVGGLAALETWQLDRHADQLADAIPARIEDLEDNRALHDLLVDAQVAERAGRALERWPRQVVLGTSDAAEGAGLGVDALLVLVIAAYGVVGGQRLVRSLTDQVGDPSRRRALHASLRAGVDRAGAYVRLALAWAAATGLLAALLAAALDLPAVFTLGVWAGAWSLLPALGTPVGFLPLVLLAGTQGPLATAAAIAAGALWWAVSAAVGRRVVARTVHVGPLLGAVALAAGLQLGWLAGAFAALIAVAVLAATLDELDARRGGAGTALEVLASDDRPEDEAAPSQVAEAGTPPAAHPVAGDRSQGDGTLVLGPIGVRSAARATAVVVLCLATLALVRGADPSLTWLVLGVVIGLAVEPVTRRLAARTRLPEPAAAGLVVLAALLALVGVAAVAVPSIAASVRRLDEQVPRVAEDLGELPLLGPPLERLEVGGRLEQLVDELPDRLADEDGPVPGVLGSLGDALVGGFWTVVIAVATLLDGRRVARRARALVPPRHRATADSTGELVVGTLVRYAAGSALVAVIAGSAVFVIALLAGIPLAPVLGVWAAAWNLVPQVGGFVGGAPLVVLALTEGSITALVALGVYLVYLQVENRVVQPVIIGRAVDLSPLVATVAVVVGGAAAGAVGAILATPAVGTAKLLLARLRGPTPPSLP